MQEFLDCPFTSEEVRKTLFDLSPSKAPGTDGFTVLFYQDAWDVMGEDITKAMLGVLNNGASLIDCNSTVVSLIPKVKEPNCMKEFRPISLCNVSYKIVARAMSNRLKSIMDSIIDLTKVRSFLKGP